MAKLDKNAVAEGANWTQRVQSEQNAALDWYKEWGTIYAKNSTAVTNLDDILKAKYAELKEYVLIVTLTFLKDIEMRIPTWVKLPIDVHATSSKQLKTHRVNQPNWNALFSTALCTFSDALNTE